MSTTVMNKQGVMDTAHKRRLDASRRRDRAIAALEKAYSEYKAIDREYEKATADLVALMRAECGKRGM